MATEGDGFVTPIDGEPPQGAEVHVLPKIEPWENDAGYRTIKVARTDGSVWYCRAIPPRLDGVPMTDIVAALPDGRSFTTGYHRVDRDDPSRVDWIMWPIEIHWSQARDLVFFIQLEEVAAFGRRGPLWRHVLPGVGRDATVLVDYIADDGTFRCSARQEELNEYGDRPYASYAIDTAGNIRRWLEEE